MRRYVQSIRWAMRQRSGRWGAGLFALVGVGAFGWTTERAVWARAGASTLPRWEAAVVTILLWTLWTLWGLLYSACWGHRRRRSGFWVALGSGTVATAGGAIMPTVASVCAATCGGAAVGAGSLMGAGGVVILAAWMPILWIMTVGVLLVLTIRLAGRMGQSLAATGQPGC